MSFTRDLAHKGANLTNFFAHTPVCCPSRSELLTGRYFHNIRANGFDTGREANCMHVNETVATPTGTPLTFATEIQNRGYAAGCFSYP